MCSHFEEDRKEDRKAEERMANQATRIHKSLEGKLSYTKQEWIKKWRKEE